MVGAVNSSITLACARSPMRRLHAGSDTSVVNAAASKSEGERTYKTLAKACETFLKMTPPLIGVVRRDPKVREAIRTQTALLIRHPNCDAARDVDAIAQRLAQSS